MTKNSASRCHSSKQLFEPQASEEAVTGVQLGRLPHSSICFCNGTEGNACTICGPPTPPAPQSDALYVHRLELQVSKF